MQILLILRKSNFLEVDFGFKEIKKNETFEGRQKNLQRAAWRSRSLRWTALT